MVDIYFSDFFKLRPNTLAQYGAFNVSLVRDLPLFIDIAESIPIAIVGHTEVRVFLYDALPKFDQIFGLG